MKLLADHNVEAPLVQKLRSAGHDVLAVAETLPPEAPDHEVLERAANDHRVLLTNDKDFGELTFLRRQASAGILLLRMPSLDTAAKAARLLQVMPLVENRLGGALVVISEQRIRRRPFADLM